MTCLTSRLTSRVVGCERVDELNKLADSSVGLSRRLICERTFSILFSVKVA